MRLSDLNIYDIGNVIQMVGAIYRSADHEYHCYFPNENRDGIPDEYDDVDMDLATWQRFLHQTDHLEAQALVQYPDGGVEKAIVRKGQRMIDQHVQWAVYRRAGYRCEYCGRDDVPLTVDHVVCWEEGGPSTEQNLKSCCRKCNKIRGNLPYAEWLQHPRYRELSRNLTGEQRAINTAMADKIAAIPLSYIKRSR